MLCAKPVLAGKVAALDGSDKSTELQDLASLAGAALIKAVDYGLEKNGNPNGVTGQNKLRPVPAIR